MSRTRRKPPTKNKVAGFFRQPKGHRQALQNEARYGAVPPNELDEIMVGRESKLPAKALERLHRRGVPREEAIQRVVNRFKVPHSLVMELAQAVYEDSEP